MALGGHDSRERPRDAFSIPQREIETFLSLCMSRPEWIVRERQIHHQELEPGMRTQRVEERFAPNLIET